MRKLIFITLTGLMALNLFTFYIAYRVTQKDMVNALEETARINAPEEKTGTLFQLSREEFDKLSWTEQGKKFKFNGRTFGVSQIVISDSSIQLLVEESPADTPAGPCKFVSTVGFVQT